MVPYSRIDILRAVAPGESYITVTHVGPGGDSLLHISDRPRVEKVLQAIDVIDALGIDPDDAAPDCWRHVHNRLPAGDRPQSYTRTRHHAWLRRKRGDAMTGRVIVLATVAMAVAAIATTMAAGLTRASSGKSPRAFRSGSTKCTPARHLTVTALGVAYPPEPLAGWLEERRYLSRGVPLIKPVLALDGQTISRAGPLITVDGRETGVAHEKDHSGRPLPLWQGCRVIGQSAIFLMNPHEPGSRDGHCGLPRLVGAAFADKVLATAAKGDGPDFEMPEGTGNDTGDVSSGHPTSPNTSPATAPSPTPDNDERARRSPLFPVIGEAADSSPSERPASERTAAGEQKNDAQTVALTATQPHVDSVFAPRSVHRSAPKSD